MIGWTRTLGDLCTAVGRAFCQRLAADTAAMPLAAWMLMVLVLLVALTSPKADDRAPDRRAEGRRLPGEPRAEAVDDLTAAAGTAAVDAVCVLMASVNGRAQTSETAIGVQKCTAL